MSGLLPVALGAAIALVGAAFVLLIDWERIRDRCVGFADAHDIAIFQDGVPFGIFLLCAAAWFVATCFLGSWTILAWLWGLA